MLSGRFHHWLINSGSLTARLQHRYPDFEVKPVLLKYAKPLVHEAKSLKLSSHNTALIREVLLMGNKNAIVFAHSVLPRHSLQGRWLGLSRLGNKPLGATLFGNPQVKRTPLMYKKLSPSHVLYQHAVKNMAVKPSYLWARRSVFSLECVSIMVTEVFLPQLLDN
jgi:chorismate--pyruvate lyase